MILSEKCFQFCTEQMCAIIYYIFFKLTKNGICIGFDCYMKCSRKTTLFLNRFLTSVLDIHLFMIDFWTNSVGIFEKLQLLNQE